MLEIEYWYPSNGSFGVAAANTAQLGEHVV
jgi:hypothetical protein